MTGKPAIGRKDDRHPLCRKGRTHVRGLGRVQLRPLGTGTAEDGKQSAPPGEWAVQSEPPVARDGSGCIGLEALVLSQSRFAHIAGMSGSSAMSIK